MLCGAGSTERGSRMSWSDSSKNWHIARAAFQNSETIFSKYVPPPAKSARTQDQYLWASSHMPLACEKSDDTVLSANFTNASCRLATALDATWQGGFLAKEHIDFHISIVDPVVVSPAVESTSSSSQQAAASSGYR